MNKKMIISIIIGTLIGLIAGICVSYSNDIVVNPYRSIGNSIRTTIIETPEAKYRIFVCTIGYAGSITAVKIED